MNRELIRRNFKFLTPVFVGSSSTSTKSKEVFDGNEEDEDNEIENKSLANYLREESGEEEKVVDSNPIAQHDWAMEYEHVKAYFQEEAKVGSDGYLFHIKRMKKYLSKVKNIMKKNGSLIIQNFVSACDDALAKIVLQEKRLNNTIKPSVIDELIKTRDERVNSAHELMSVRNNVKDQIDRKSVV